MILPSLFFSLSLGLFLWISYRLHGLPFALSLAHVLFYKLLRLPFTLDYLGLGAVEELLNSKSLKTSIC
jgi:hypothetical protein